MHSVVRPQWWIGKIVPLFTEESVIVVLHDNHSPKRIEFRVERGIHTFIDGQTDGQIDRPTDMQAGCFLTLHIDYSNCFLSLWSQEKIFVVINKMVSDFFFFQAIPFRDKTQEGEKRTMTCFAQRNTSTKSNTQTLLQYDLKAAATLKIFPNS